MALDLAATRITDWYCGRCDVTWKSGYTIPCWCCDSVDNVEKRFPKIYPDVCQADPVAGPPVAP
jgi:hypothetical protein